MEKLINNIKKISAEMNSLESIKLCEHIMTSRKNDKFHIGIIGEFNRGKTSMLNHLLDLDFLPTDFLPATSKITILEYGETQEIIFKYKHKKNKVVKLSKENLSHLADQNIGSRNNAEIAIVKVPNEILKGGLTFIDTPGVNDLNEMNDDITKNILPYCDALLFMLDPVTALTKSESSFIKSNLLEHQFPVTFFVLGKSDRLSLSDLISSIKGSKQRIRKVLGENLPVIPFSIKEEVKTNNTKVQNFDIGLETTEKELDIGKNNLLKAINELIVKGRDNKLKKEQSQLKFILDLLEQECHLKIDLNSIPTAKKELILLHAKNEGISQNEKFEKFLISIDNIGKNALKKMVGKSFDNFKSSLRDDIVYQMNRRSNLEKFISDQLPVYINYEFKKYYENQGKKIEVYFKKFIDHISKEYTKNFYQPLEVVFNKHSIDLPRVEYSKRNRSRSNFLEILSLGVVGGIIGSLVTPGMGTIIGAQMGRIFEKRKIELKDEQIRDVYISEMEGLIDQEFEDYQNNVENVINQRIKKVKQKITEFHLMETAQNKKNQELLMLSQNEKDIEAIEKKLEKIKNYRLSLEAL